MRCDVLTCCCRAFNSAPVDQVRVVVIGQVGSPFLHVCQLIGNIWLL